MGLFEKLPRKIRDLGDFKGKNYEDLQTLDKEEFRGWISTGHILLCSQGGCDRKTRSVCRMLVESELRMRGDISPLRHTSA